MDSQNTNIYELKSILRANADLPLLIKLDDHTINPGYHITEVKHAVVNSMDCGQGTEQWDEIIVQLLDGSALHKGEHMKCLKFVDIVSAAIKSRDIDENTLTYIEFAPNNGALRKLVIDSIETTGNEVITHLSSPTAMCKPLQRAMAAQSAKNQGTTDCCVSDKPQKQLAPCCDKGDAVQSKVASCC